MNTGSTDKMRANGTARILLWALWPFVWVALLFGMRALLGFIRSGLVSATGGGGHVSTVAQVYGLIHGVVMTAMMFALFFGFPMIARWTTKKGKPPRSGKSHK